MIERQLKHIIIQDFNRNKVIVILGARQTGKTTLLNELSTNANQLLKLKQLAWLILIPLLIAMAQLIHLQ